MTAPSYDNWLYAARLVIKALEDVGEPWCCFVGGMAARLWGVRRTIKDLDVIVLQPDVDPETLKRSICQRYPHLFYLKRPRNRHHTWRKLYLHIPRTQHKVKVDILLSTEKNLEVPDGFHRNHFVHINGLPVAPLYFVLYHKLLGWEDRVASRERWKKEKADDVDYPDIIRLCEILRQHGIYPLSKTHMGRLYKENFQRRAEYFCERYDKDLPRMRLEAIGFNV